jgi:putative membrane protein
VRVTPVTLLAVLTAAPAAAHGPDAVRPDTLSQAWRLEPTVLAPLLVALALYGLGVARLWASAGRGRGLTWRCVLAFGGGAAALVIALVTPLDALGGTLLSAHMAQHALLIAVAPPLLLLGRPGVAFAWALAGREPWRSLAHLGDRLSRPLPAAALHGAALWVWHAPAAFDAALASPPVHALEHVTFFGTALLFWRAVLDARTSRRAGPALAAAFATLLHGGLLGGLITMAPAPLYTWYRARTAPWGLTPLEDQQLAGLLMWVPLGTVYLGACLVLASRLVVPAGDGPRDLAGGVPLTRSPRIR